MKNIDSEKLLDKEKIFCSFFDSGYEGDFFDIEGVKHLDNRFIGVVVDGDEKYTAYLDPVTAEIFPQSIFEKSEDGELVEVDPFDVEI